MRKSAYLVAVAGVLIATGLIFARSKRVNQIPNGNVFSCGNCHVNPGGPRNPFGQEVERNYLDSNGDVIWNSALASLDSDGDGFTNGQELQDPNGAWTVGQPQPGDPGAVTNPGDPSSVPATAVLEPTIQTKPTAFGLGQPYPNPFNSATMVTFTLPHQVDVVLDVVSLDGRLVRRLAATQMAAGQHRARWDGTDGLGAPVSSGVYLIVLRAGAFRSVGRVVLLR